MSEPEVVVVGAPGAGKTTVGRLLAEKLDVEFRDTDEDIEIAMGKSISDLFVDEGEGYFRVLEAEAVAHALEEHDGVLAIGGGAVLNSDTRMALAEHTVAYLVVDVPEAVRRIGMNRDRPLLLGNPRAQLRALLAERRPLYEAVATFSVDTAGRTADEVAELVLERL